MTPEERRIQYAKIVIGCIGLYLMYGLLTAINSVV